MSHIYPDPIQGPNSPLANTFSHQPMQHYPEAVVPQISLRDYFAAAETLDDLEDLSMASAVALAGPIPTENSRTNPIEWLKWEAKWRAELRFIRADAMIKAREVKP